MNPITSIADRFNPNSDANLTRKGFEPAADTSSQQELTGLILQGHTQHLNSRPLEGLGAQPANVQETVFALNLVTKAEGNHETAMAAAFDRVQNAKNEYLGDITAPLFDPILPPAGPVRTAIEAAGLTDACDATKSPLERQTALLNTKAHVDALAAGTADNLKDTLDRMYSSPKKLVTEVQRKLVNGVLNDIASVAPGSLPAELAALNTMELTASLNDSISTGRLEPQAVERLSTVIAALPDATMRKTAFESLRGAVMLEALRGIALTAAGSEADPKYDQYLMALANKFVFRDGGGTSDDLGKLLANISYKKGEAEEALKLDIAGNAGLNAYLTELMNQTAPGIPVAAELKVNGLSSKGEGFARTHELLGIVRRGAEAAEWYDLKGKPVTDKETYLTTNYGYTAGSPQLTQAVTRLDALLAAGTGGAVSLVDTITAAATGVNTDLGNRYTNIMRAQRNYLENGGNLVEVQRNSEVLDANQFIRAIQTQANPELGVAEGGVATDRNRVLTVEEQRATVLADYEALSGRKGLRGWIDKVKKVVPRIAKAVGLMALATAGAAIPVIAGPLAIGLAVTRVAGVIATVKMGAPVIANAVRDRNWKVLGAAGAGILANVAAQVFLPGSLGFGVTLLTESIGTEIYAEKQLSKEVTTIRNAHIAYETAFQTKLDSLDLTNADDLTFLTRLSRSINIDINDPALAAAAGGPDKDTVINAIISAREVAHEEKNMNLLRSFSQVMEERMTVERDALNAENLEARRVYDDTQQMIAAYAVGSSATKLGFGIGRGAIAGYENNGLVGGFLGALGIDGLFEKSESVESAEAYSEVRKELEADFDRHATELGINHDGHNVVGLIEGADGTDYAVIDLDNDPSTLEMLVNVDHMNLENPSTADLDFSESRLTLTNNTELFKTQVSLLTGTPLSEVQSVAVPEGGNSFATFSTPQGTYSLVTDGADLPVRIEVTTSSIESGNTTINATFETVAGPGDSQWSLIEKTLRSSYPNLTDQQVWTATANAMNEAGTDGVYREIFDNRTLGVSGGTVSTGDKLTLADIRDMAPNTFASIPGNPVDPSSTTIIPGTSEVLSTETLELGLSDGQGLIVFDLEGNNHTLYGTFTPGNPSSTAGIGGASATTTTQSSTQTTDDSTATTSTTTTSNSDVTPGGINSNTFGIITGDNQGINLATGQEIGSDIGGGNPEDLNAANSTFSSTQTEASTVEQTTAATSEAYNPVDTITISDPGIGGHYTIYEDTVSKVIIEQRLNGAPALELDTKTHDILNIDPGHSITYKTPDGAVHTLEASGPIKLEFVGNEGNPIDVRSGQQSILGAAADTLTSWSNDLDGVQGDLARINNAAGELGQDLSRLGASKPYFDPGFGNNADFMINQDSYMTNDNTAHAYLGGFSVTDGSGSQTIIPYDNVIKMGPGYITHMDPATNTVTTTNGSEIVGIGTSWTQDPQSGVMIYGQPQKFVFNPNGVVDVVTVPVEQAWWDSSVYGPSLNNTRP